MYTRIYCIRRDLVVFQYNVLQGCIQQQGYLKEPKVRRKQSIINSFAKIAKLKDIKLRTT